MKNRSKFFLALVLGLLGVSFSAQPAFGHDPPVIAPTRLDFDASHAPKNCDDVNTFRSSLEVWVPQTTWHENAERRLFVRVGWSLGHKRADVSLVDGRGTILAERHEDYPPETECHLILSRMAYHAAELLGAFKPLPPKPPAPCPTLTAAPPCPLAQPCPSCPSWRPLVAMESLTPTLDRFWFGVGAFVGSGMYSELNGGPYLLFGFTPSHRLRELAVEVEGSWTAQLSASSMISRSFRTDAVPLVGSVCWVRGIVRFCGGLATTFYSANQSSNHALHLLFAGNVRVGTEWFARGPLSLRVEVFGRVGFTHRHYGTDTALLAEPDPFAAGVAVLGAWASD